MPVTFQKSRIVYFDLLRAFACLSVIMIHTSATYLLGRDGSINFWIGNIFDSASRAAVPLFVMISGALMLDERYQLTKERWLRHLRKMLVFFVFWSVSYSVVFNVLLPLTRQEAINSVQAVIDIVKGYYHLWFIPMITGLYLLLPMLRLWVKRENKRYVEYYLLLSVVFEFALPQAIQLASLVKPSAQILGEVLNYFNMKHVGGFCFWFILGWYLHQFDIPFRKLLYALGVLGLGAMIGGTYGLTVLAGVEDFILYSEFSVTVLLYTAAIFVLAKNACAKAEAKKHPLLRASGFISRYSLGIYAVHAGIHTQLNGYFFRISAAISVPVVFVSCTVISIVLAYGLSKVPGVKKVI